LSWVDIRDTDWDAAVGGSKGAVVVEFWHQTCPTCRKIEKSVRELPGKLSGGVKLLRFDVLASRENRRLAIVKDVIGTPTFKIYCNGKEIGEVVGEETLTDLGDKLNNILKGCV